MTAGASTRFVQQVFRDFVKQNGHDAVCIPHLIVTKAVPGKVSATLKIEQKNGKYLRDYRSAIQFLNAKTVNRLNGLHGGLISSLVDTMGSLALSSKGYWMTGVTTDMSTTFIRGAGSPGDSIRIEGHLLNMGKTLAFTRVDIYGKNDKLAATGTHTKYIAQAVKNDHGKNIVFDDSGSNVVEGQLQDDPAMDAEETK